MARSNRTPSKRITIGAIGIALVVFGLLLGAQAPGEIDSVAARTYQAAIPFLGAGLFLVLWAIAR